MPEFVYDIPTNKLASYFAIIAVGSVIFGTDRQTSSTTIDGLWTRSKRIDQLRNVGI
jgi:hypothetical protein